METLIKPDEDTICIYVLDENTVQRTITYGTPQPEQPGSIII